MPIKVRNTYEFTRKINIISPDTDETEGSITVTFEGRSHSDQKIINEQGDDEVLRRAVKKVEGMQDENGTDVIGEEAIKLAMDYPPTRNAMIFTYFQEAKGDYKKAKN